MFLVLMTTNLFYLFSLGNWVITFFKFKYKMSQVGGDKKGHFRILILFLKCDNWGWRVHKPGN